MATIKAVVDTVIKSRNEDSATLSKKELRSVKAGDLFEVSRLTPSKHKHVRVQFETPIQSNEEENFIQPGFLFEQHWEIDPKLSSNVNIKLPVVYRNQIDNSTNLFGTGYRQCNLTSNAMMLDYLLGKYGHETLAEMAVKGGYREAESVYAQVLRKYGDTIYHEAQTKALREFGVESYMSTTLSVSDLITCLEFGTPVVVSVDYKSSGHVILIVGCNSEKRFFWVHDPYGCRAGSANYYPFRGRDYGKYDTYSYNLMQRIWGDMGGKDKGWGRVVTSVKGVLTGCPTGL